MSQVPKINVQATSRVRLCLLTLSLFLLHGCAGLTQEEQSAKRAELDQMAEKVIATLLETEPDAQGALDKSLGYTVIDMTVTKIPMIGAGGGFGVVVDKGNGTHSYIKVSRFEVGGGLGGQQFKVIIFFYDKKLLERAVAGAWHFEAGAEATAGKTGTEGKVAASDQGYRAFKIAEGGAAATVTIRAAYAEPYLK